nr:uncharacterized protein Neto1-dt [Peromyscus maniculatus bairdii]XP_042120015.1 uncharacterized protein Neto1-dt [Peromyscus maniculatus bairdii]
MTRCSQGGERIRERIRANRQEEKEKRGRRQACERSYELGKGKAVLMDAADPGKTEVHHSRDSMVAPVVEPSLLAPFPLYTVQKPALRAVPLPFRVC